MYETMNLVGGIELKFNLSTIIWKGYGGIWVSFSLLVCATKSHFPILVIVVHVVIGMSLVKTRNLGWMMMDQVELSTQFWHKYVRGYERYFSLGPFIWCLIMSLALWKIGYLPNKNDTCIDLCDLLNWVWRTSGQIRDTLFANNQA